MKHEQETIGNLMQYQQLGKFYNLYFKRLSKYNLYEDESIMESFVGEASFYGLVSENEMALLEDIIERIGKKSKKELNKYAIKLINKNK